MSYPKREEDQVLWWQTQIEYSRRRMKPLFEASRVLERQYYNDPSSERESSLAGDGLSGDQHLRRVRSSLVFGYIDQSLANMIDRNPEFRCTPETPHAAEKISPDDPGSLTRYQGASKIVNYRYRELNQLRVDERVATDAFLYPYGVAKIGYNLDFDVRKQELLLPEDGMVLDNPEEEGLFLAIGQETMVTGEQDHRGHVEQHLGLLRELAATPGPASDMLVRLVESHIKLHKDFLYRRAPSANTNVRFESPFAVRWLPDMFLTDVLSLEGPNDARWIAFGWELPIDEVQADPVLRNTGGLEPTRWKDAPERPEGLETDGLDLVRGWEIWALDFPMGRGKFEDRLIVVAEGCNKFLRNEDEWPYDRLDDYPAETLVFNPGFRSWYNKSPLLMGGADTVQGLVNELLDSYLAIIRRQKNVWLVDPSSGIDDQMISDILESPDCSVVEVPGLAEAKGQVVIPLPFPEVPPEKGELLRILQSMFDRTMGTPQPVALPQSDSATEASIMEKRNTSREGRRSGLLGEFQVRKARKMWQLDCQYRPQKLFLVDDEAMAFVELDAEMARGEYQFTMDITSHVEATSVERSQGMDLLNLFAGLTPVLSQTFGVPPNLPELARRLLSRGFGEKNPEIIMPSKPPGGPEGTPEGVGPEGIMGQGSGTEFANPEAQGAQEAVKNGRMVDRNIGPLDRDTYNRAQPSRGRLEGQQESR